MKYQFFWPSDHDNNYIITAITTLRLLSVQQKQLVNNSKTMSDLTTVKGLPHFATGEVVKGFGRGSKELGIPTANFSEDVVDNLPPEIDTGVYFGFAQVDKSPVYKMVMSIGWNPFYGNKKKSMETHVMHKFHEDFYGKQLKVAILGFLRPEKNFGSLDELKTAIQEDINQAEFKLDSPPFSSYKENKFFSVSC